MEHLLESTKYSDLTLTCDGQSIPVHRAIVCPQSGFFDAACSGKFLESVSRNIDLDDDDVESVRKVLSFMYTGTYEDEQTGPNALQLARQTGESHSINSAGAENTPEDEVPVLWSSVRVYALADKYDVQPLKILARDRFEDWIRLNWRHHKLSALAREVFNTTPSSDLGLRDTMVNTLAEHSSALLQQESWTNTLEENPQMSYMIAVKLSSKLEKYTGEPSAMASLRDKVNSRRHCRHCGAAFNTCIDAIEPGILRCRECRTRH